MGQMNQRLKMVLLQLGKKDKIISYVQNQLYLLLICFHFLRAQVDGNREDFPPGHGAGGAPRSCALAGRARVLPGLARALELRLQQPGESEDDAGDRGRPGARHGTWSAAAGAGVLFVS